MESELDHSFDANSSPTKFQNELYTENTNLVFTRFCYYVYHIFCFVFQVSIYVVVHCTVDFFDAHILVEVPITVIRAILEVKLFYGNEKFIVWMWFQLSNCSPVITSAILWTSPGLCIIRFDSVFIKRHTLLLT